jgi:dCTP deaminase
MILSDSMIRMAMANKNIIIEPPPFDKSIQSCSIDLHLGTEILRYKDPSHHQCYGSIDPRIPTRLDIVERIEISSISPYRVYSDEFLLGSTLEYIEIGSNICARIEGKSSLGRCGLTIHITAGFIDPGYRGNITLEIKNMNRIPIELWNGMKIAQICFQRIEGKTLRPYGSDEIGSRYQHSRGVCLSKGLHDEL